LGVFRLRNDLYCVEWGVKLYSLTHVGGTLPHDDSDERDCSRELNINNNNNNKDL